MLCAMPIEFEVTVVDPHFDELRELCTAAGDKASLAIAMAGMVMDHAYQGRIRQASLLASEAMALIESLGDPTLTVALSLPAIYARDRELANQFRGSRSGPDVVDLANSECIQSNSHLRSPLSAAFTTRAIAGSSSGSGWSNNYSMAWPSAPDRRGCGVCHHFYLCSLFSLKLYEQHLEGGRCCRARGCEHTLAIGDDPATTSPSISARDDVQ